MQEEPVEISDSEGELDKAFAACSPKLIVTRVDPNSEDDEEMDLNLRRGLKDLLTGRNKGSSSKEVSKSQVPANLPLPPLFPTASVDLLLNPNLKKKRKVPEVEDEGEVLPQKGDKQHKTAKDKWAPTVESREDPSGAKVHTQQRTWAPQLEIDGATIPWNTSIKEFQ